MYEVEENVNQNFSHVANSFCEWVVDVWIQCGNKGSNITMCHQSKLFFLNEDRLWLMFNLLKTYKPFCKNFDRLKQFSKAVCNMWTFLVNIFSNFTQNLMQTFFLFHHKQNHKIAKHDKGYSLKRLLLCFRASYQPYSNSYLEKQQCSRGIQQTVLLTKFFFRALLMRKQTMYNNIMSIN